MKPEERVEHPGPRRGSPGAHKVAEAHRGHHTHDERGGFAANPQLAKDAGHRGGEAVKCKYGVQFYHDIGKKGGGATNEKYGSNFYAEIGHRGRLIHSIRLKERLALVQAPPR